MQKLTIQDFSGGIQEAIVPDDFTQRQWAQLKGIIPTDELNFETQWPIQTVGTSFTSVRAVYPLMSSAGTFLVAIKTNGTLWWCQAPSTISSNTYATANAVTWTEITTAANVDRNGDPISILSNTDYKFVCAVPFKGYKYVVDPDETTPTNPSLDAPLSSSLELSSGVLINSTTVDGASNQVGDPSAPQQVIVAYVDTTLMQVSAVTFPNARRIPLHDSESGDFLDAQIDETTLEDFPNWLEEDTPGRAFHPYTYLDINATLLPGRGIIPRANVGVMKNDLLLLGDIEWRADLSAASPVFGEEYLIDDDGDTEFGKYSTIDTTGAVSLKAASVDWPAEINDTSRVVFNEGPGNFYFKADDSMFAQIVAKTADGTDATITTKYLHNFTVGDTVEITGIDSTFNGVHEITAVGAGPTANEFTYALAETVAWTALSTEVGGATANAITFKESTGGIATITTTAAHNFVAGDTVEISHIDGIFDGVHQITSVPTATTFTFLLDKDVVNTAVPVTVPPATAWSPAPVGEAFTYTKKLRPTEYWSIPNAYPQSFYLSASRPGSKIKAVTNVNTAYHLLNDDNTGPHRGGIYFAIGGEIDQFDPAGVLIPGKTDVSIAGLHVLDNRVIVITTAGSKDDGVFRIVGNISNIIRYGQSNNYGAVRIELIRGGIGAPLRTTTTHKNYSTMWSEGGVVVFIDRTGGIWATNGQWCDRIDRYGPRTPQYATENDHAAELGKQLFVWRNNRLLCFTMLATDPTSGNGCWTEVVVPSAISNMIGARNELYFIMNGKVHRMSPNLPDVERGTVNGAYNASTNPNGVTLDITVSTATAGDSGSHQKANWHRFGMTFSSPTSCVVKTVRVQSTGALNIVGSASLPDVQYLTTLNRTYNDAGILGEFVVPAGIGPQAMASATVVFTGYVRLQSASFWYTGNTPRFGDQ